MRNSVKRSSPLAYILIGFGTVSVLVGIFVPLFAFSDMEDATGKIIMLSAFCGTGLVMLIFGLRELKKANRIKAARDRLIQAGYFVTADVVEIVRNTYVRINGQCPFHIICRYIENGRTYLFKSESFMNNPAKYIIDNKIRVWVDRKDFGDYYVDVGELFGYD